MNDVNEFFSWLGYREASFDSKVTSTIGPIKIYRNIYPARFLNYNNRLRSGNCKGLLDPFAKKPCKLRDIRRETRGCAQVLLNPSTNIPAINREDIYNFNRAMRRRQRIAPTFKLTKLGRLYAKWLKWLVVYSPRTMPISPKSFKKAVENYSTKMLTIYI